MRYAFIDWNVTAITISKISIKQEKRVVSTVLRHWY